MSARLAALRPAVIRGNASEIMALAGEAGAAGKGVDSTRGSDAARDAARRLAERTGAVVAATGAVDYVTDGTAMTGIANGDPMLSRVTGTGCMATALCGAFLGAGLPAYDATVAGLAVIGVAAEQAIAGANGPASFQVALIDALYRLDDAGLAAGMRLGMKPGFDLRLMLVTDAAMMARRGLLATVRAAVAGGVTIVQLRDKQASDAELIGMARALGAALRPLGIPLIVNDRPEAAKAADADGVHVGQEDGDPAAARALLGPEALIGLSVTHAGEAGTVDPAVVDYVGLGPVFASATKADAAPPLGLAGLLGVGAMLPVPIVAIGGIDTGNAGAIMAAGAAGVAVVSAICAADDPRAAAAALRGAIEGRGNGEKPLTSHHDRLVF